MQFVGLRIWYNYAWKIKIALMFPQVVFLSFLNFKVAASEISISEPCCKIWKTVVSYYTDTAENNQIFVVSSRIRTRIFCFLDQRSFRYVLYTLPPTSIFYYICAYFSKGTKFLGGLVNHRFLNLETQTNVSGAK